MKLRLFGLAFILLSLFGLGKANATKDCPQKHFTGICIQVITYARNPETGTCCVYPNPCVVPDGWQTSQTGCP
jgi:hypothetical protein